MSAGFQATPGIGKVDLEWNDQEVNYDDFLGFNLYRYQYDEHGNWIQRTEYSVEGSSRIPEYITERSIQYFE